MTTTITGATGIDNIQAATGSVLQVVNFVVLDTTASSSSTFADTSTTLSITPSSTSSKILSIVNMNGCGKSSTTNAYMDLKLLRGSTSLVEFGGQGGYTGTALELSWGSTSTTYLDSPNSTSATTYKLSTDSSSSVFFNRAEQGTGHGSSTITLMEIGA